MQHFTSLEGVYLKRTWLTVGSFDGIHLGHQEIIHKLISGAHQASAQAVVLTFHPHPSIVLGKRRDGVYLTTPQERAVLLEKMGVDVLVEHPFDLTVASQSARDFLSYLTEHLNFRQMLIGDDFAMGHNREGDVPTLRALGEELGYQVQVIPPVEIDGMRVSSSRIRALLAAGEVDRVARVLGRPYRVVGLVEKGQGRGQTIGIPTANLAISGGRAIPSKGVYACRARLSTGVFGAVTNIGVRPTFENPADHLTVEAHILNFEDDLYGEWLELDFIGRLRGEKRFPSPQALADQIRTDIADARELLKTKV